MNYTVENCVAACKYCNMGKRDLPLEKFVDCIKRVKDNRKNVFDTKDELVRQIGEKFILKQIKELVKKGSIVDYFDWLK